MAYTQAQVDDLEAAIARGALSFSYSTPQGERRVTYRSLEDMHRQLAIMQRALGITSARPNRVLAQHTKGLRKGSSVPYSEGHYP